MSADELKESFKKLTLQGSKVMEANEELQAAYNAEGAQELAEEEKADIEKTEQELGNERALLGEVARHPFLYGSWDLRLYRLVAVSLALRMAMHWDIWERADPFFGPQRTRYCCGVGLSRMRGLGR
uniref:Uncharacterized protein n=1 Tax=Knipowitschia caucasica TaxID=637954 RepID=A0AAV2LJE2_KNICA